MINHRLVYCCTSFIALSIFVVSQSGFAQSKEAEQRVGSMVQFSDPSDARGSFSFAVPLSTPPGVSGFSPSIGISYSSDGGNGVAGLGWSVSVSSIERMGPARTLYDGSIIHPRGTPEYSTTDEYYLDGQRLIPCRSGAGSCLNGADGSYRTEFDSFAVIKKISDSRWEVTDGSGSKKIYNMAWTRDGTSATTYRWALGELQRIDGTVLATYTYNNRAVYAPEVSTIEYGVKDNGQAPGVRVTYVYEPRTDVRVSYFYGRSEEHQRLTAIQVDGLKSAAPMAVQLSKMVLAYYPISAASEVSRLQSVTLCGTTCTQGQKYDFTYGEPEGWAPSLQAVASIASLNPEIFQTADLNGDGMPDIKHTGLAPIGDTSWHDGPLYNAAGTLVYSSSSDISKKVTSITPALPDDNLPSVMGHFTGKTSSDQIYRREGTAAGTLWTLLPGSPTTLTYGVPTGFDLTSIPPTHRFQSWSCPSGHCSVTSANIDLGIRGADVNGDGLEDLVQGLDDRGFIILHAWINRGNRFVSDDRYAPPIPFVSLLQSCSPGGHIACQAYQGPSVLSLGVQILDLNGDGIDDIVQSYQVTQVVLNRTHSSDSCRPNGGSYSVPVDEYAYSPSDDASRVYLGTGKPGATWSLRNLRLPAPLTISEVTDVLDSGDPCGPGAYQQTYVSRNYGTGLQFADLNGDGLPDLIESRSHSLESGDGILNGDVYVPMHADAVYANWPLLAGNMAFPVAPELYPVALTMLGRALKECVMTADGNACDSGKSKTGMITDFDSDGAPDILLSDAKLLRSNPTNAPAVGRITSITNPLGGHQYVTYRSINSSKDNPDLPFKKIVVDTICISDGSSRSSNSPACTGNSDVETKFAYKGAKYDEVRRALSGFAYVRATKKGSPVGSPAKTYHQMSETFFNLNWCNPGSSYLSLSSSIVDGKLDACEHRNSSFLPSGPYPFNPFMNYDAPIDTANCSAGTDSQILSSTASYSEATAPFGSCPAANTEGPFFFPARASISTNYDPATPSVRFTNQQVSVYSASDKSRGRVTEQCVYESGDVLKTDCAAGYKSKKGMLYKTFTSVPETGWPLDRVDETYDYDETGTKYRTTKLSYDVETNPLYLPQKTEVKDRAGTVLRTSIASYDADGNVVMDKAYRDIGLGIYRTVRSQYYRKATPFRTCVDDETGTNNCLLGSSRDLSRITYDSAVPYRIAETRAPGPGNYWIASQSGYDGQNRVTSEETRTVVNGAPFSSGTRISRSDVVITINGVANYNYVHVTSKFSEPAVNAPAQLVSDTYLDGLGRKTKMITNSMSSSIAYNRLGVASDAYAPSTVGPMSGSRQVTTFDRFGRAYQTLQNGNVAATMEYSVKTDGVQTKSTVTGQAGAEIRWSKVDTLGRKIQSGEQDPSTTRKVTYNYDVRGNLTKAILPTVAGGTREQMAISYDDLGQKSIVVDRDLSKCADPNLCPWLYVYDHAGNLTKQTDAKGSVTRFVFDRLGRKTWRINCLKSGVSLSTEKLVYYEPMSETQSFMTSEVHLDPTQIPTGTLQGRLDALCTTNINQDDLVIKNALDTIRADSGFRMQAQVQRNYQYTPAGALFTKTTTIQLPINPAQKRSTKRWTKSVEVMDYMMNSVSGAAKSALTRVYTSTDGSNWIEMDDPGNPGQKIADTITFKYDSYGRETAKLSQKPGRSVANKTFDEEGRLKSKKVGLTADLAGNVSSPLGIMFYTYETAYDSIDRGRMRSMLFSKCTAGGTCPADAGSTASYPTYSLMNYQYDPAGKITQFQSKLAGATNDPRLNFGPVTKTFTYDDLSQLRGYTYTSSRGAFTGTFVYDILGNRTSGTSEQTPISPLIP